MPRTLEQPFRPQKSERKLENERVLTVVRIRSGWREEMGHFGQEIGKYKKWALHQKQIQLSDEEAKETQQ